MEIKPKVGIDHVRLGRNMNEVRALWGQPKSISNFIALEDKPEDRSVTWGYTNGIEFSFD